MEILHWLEQVRKKSHQQCTQVQWSDMSSWQMAKGAIRHHDNRFFSIIGICANSNHPAMHRCQQPIINQPEIGILGFLIQRQRDQLLLLVQAKAEPGNIGDVQIAPTVQATVSNYTQAHGGKPTPYLEYFLTPEDNIILDSLQSEQGTRFLGKYNRNMMIEVSGFVTSPHTPYWKWYPWESLRALLVDDFKINTDARSVLACSDWVALSAPVQPFERGRQIDEFGLKLYGSFHKLQEDDADLKIHQVLENWRTQHTLELEKVPLEKLKGWHIDAWSVQNEEMSFQLQGYKVEVEGREVSAWDQPLLLSPEQGEITLVCQMQEGVLHFLLRKSFEIGFSEGVQFGPTMQINLHQKNEKEVFNNCLAILLGNKALIKTHLTCLQSDEGGRFYQCVSRYSVVEIAEQAHLPPDEDSCWITLGQIHCLIKHQGMLTNEARSAISLLLWYL